MGDFLRLPIAYTAFGLFILAGLHNDPVVIDDSSNTGAALTADRPNRAHLLLRLLWRSWSSAKSAWRRRSKFTFFPPFYTIS